MKSLSDIKQLFKEIKMNLYVIRTKINKNDIRLKNIFYMKISWLYIKKTQIAAWRTYQYYLKIKGNWDRLSFQQLLKMKKLKFLNLLKRREKIKRKILLTFSNLDQNHMTEDYVNEQYMTKNNHMKEDHVNR